MSTPPTKLPTPSTAPAEGFIVGRFDHALDPKRRLTIPSCWRQQMGHPTHLFVMPDSREKCLNILPPAEMAVLIEKLRQTSFFKAGMGNALTRFGEQCEDLTLDGQGRIRIKDALLEFAELDAMVAMIGGVNRIQLWTPRLKPEKIQVDQAGLATALEELGW